MRVKYVPNLRFKKGERTALRHLTQAGKEDVIPLILVGSDQFKGKKQTESKAPVPAPAALTQELAEVWGTTPFYLDASQIQTELGFDHGLVAIADECRARSLRLNAERTCASRISSQSPRAKEPCRILVNDLLTRLSPSIDLAWPHESTAAQSHDSNLTLFRSRNAAGSIMSTSRPRIPPAHSPTRRDAAERGGGRFLVDKLSLGRVSQPSDLDQPRTPGRIGRVT
jgi:Beta protein